MTIPFTRLLCVDTETTDLEPGQIIQIAFKFWDSHDRPVPEPFMARYMPTVPVAESAVRVNGYDPNLWANIYGAQPLAVEDLYMWTQYLEGATILGANPHFDLGFLRAEYARLGLKCPRWNYRTVDVQAMATAGMVFGDYPDTKLDTLRAYFGLPVHPQHDATQDVEDTIVVFERLLDLAITPRSREPG